MPIRRLQRRHAKACEVIGADRQGHGHACTNRPVRMSRQRDLDIRKLQGDVAAAERIDRIDRCGSQVVACAVEQHRSEEHTYELQSLMRISYAVFWLKKKHITY